MEKPEDMKDIMVTYIKTITHGPYNMETRKEEVTKRGFYSEAFDHYSIPPDWQMFNGMLLPHGWGGDRITHDQVLNWTYCED